MDKRKDLTFGEALAWLKAGEKVTRPGWNGKGMWLFLVTRGYYGLGNSLLSTYEPLPWIGMKTADDKFVPWLASQTDLLSEDWMTTENQDELQDEEMEKLPFQPPK